jgi:DNA repair protein RecO (recombination protein O)
MKILKNPAIIIRHLNYAEADRIVTFFTREYGLLKGFARGARKSRKRFGTALEPFSEVVLYWTEPASGSLASLKEAELVDLHLGLREDLASVSLAAFSCELVEGLIGEGQAHPQTFDLLKAFLDHLSHNPPSWEARLLLELRLLVLAGYSPHLLHCSKCGKTFREEVIYFETSQGGSLCPQCIPDREVLSVSLLTLGSLARSLRTPLTLFEGFRFSPRTVREAHAILQQVLSQHLISPLKSLPLLDQSMPLSPDHS